MSQIVASFSLQVLEGPNNNVVSLSRSQSNLLATYSVAVGERIAIPASSTDLLITLPTNVTQVLIIENPGSTPLVVKVNANNGTAFNLPKTTGFLAVTTSNAVTSVYVSNADPINIGTLQIFVGG